MKNKPGMIAVVFILLCAAYAVYSAQSKLKPAAATIEKSEN